ncbi:hypothetical protein [uncultured Clostridium sp.]|uniref:hypothetical protein n=1 Tax=uncultured Clostridium sp. TaxID=59620 RepID=UPI00261EB131|nr:hypothetical protein [uncultured Clostridium sp.]
MDKYMQFDIEEAITNYISYLEKQENSNSRYNREKIRNGYKALENKELQVEYLVDGFNSMLNSLELDGRFGEQYRVEAEVCKEKYEKMLNENCNIKREHGYKTDFNMEIKDYLDTMKIVGDGSSWESKRLDRCQKALDDVTLQNLAVKEIIKDLVCKIRIMKNNNLKSEVI